MDYYLHCLAFKLLIVSSGHFTFHGRIHFTLCSRVRPIGGGSDNHCQLAVVWPAEFLRCSCSRACSRRTFPTKAPKTPAAARPPAWALILPALRPKFPEHIPIRSFAPPLPAHESNPAVV